MTLFAGEKIYDDYNYHELIGNGQEVMVNGERRFLSRTPKPPGHDCGAYSEPFSKHFGTYPRSEWSALLKDQAIREGRVSDLCDFEPNDQDGLPTCWSQGPAQAASTFRRKMGLPFVRMSACSTAVPISGGHSGGYEGDALSFAAKYGWASVDIWPENNTDRRLIQDPRVAADRQNFIALQWLEISTWDEWVTACIMQLPGAFAYNWMSHVMMSSDIVEIEANSFGLRVRNSWGRWGAPNKYGFYGFNVYREGRGTPDSGFVLCQMTSSIGGGLTPVVAI